MMNKNNQHDNSDAIMRKIANRLINRILEDHRNGVLMFTHKRDTIIKTYTGFRFIDYATYKIPNEN